MDAQLRERARGGDKTAYFRTGEIPERYVRLLAFCGDEEAREFVSGLTPAGWRAVDALPLGRWVVVELQNLLRRGDRIHFERVISVAAARACLPSWERSRGLRYVEKGRFGKPDLMCHYGSAFVALGSLHWIPRRVVTQALAWLEDPSHDRLKAWNDVIPSLHVPEWVSRPYQNVSRLGQIEAATRLVGEDLRETALEEVQRQVWKTVEL